MNDSDGTHGNLPGGRAVAAIPDGLHICEVCGDLACGAICPTCEELSAHYDGRYHAARAAEFFSRLPRDLAPDDGLAWDGLGGMRAAAFVLKLTAVAGTIAFLLGLALRWWLR